MTSNVVPSSRSTAGPDSGRAPGRLRGRALEARERLTPDRLAIPAPRSPGGVQMPAPFGSAGAGTVPADVQTAIEALISELAAVEDAETPAHRALARIEELTSTGIPEEGWSADDRFAPEVLSEAAVIAAGLHTSAAALLERLDAADLPAAAVSVDALVNTLRVVRMVADLEVFALTRG